MSARTQRFERKPNQPKDEADIIRFEPAEEAELLNQSNATKTIANAKFVAGEYTTAIEHYTEAFNTCPNYLFYERAVLKSNIAACHLKLEEWKETTNTASEAINDLEKLEPKKPVKEPKQGEDGEEIVEEAEEEVEEIISAGAAKAADTSESSKRKADIERMKSKALLRRARARSELGGWSNLAGAEEDYRVLSAMSCLTSTDKKVVQQQLRALPPRVKAAQEVEMGEMMGKLKQLGNGLLKPFGLSTDMFNMVKDEKTGGYSMNFNQGGGK